MLTLPLLTRGRSVLGQELVYLMTEEGNHPLGYDPAPKMLLPGEEEEGGPLSNG